MKSRIPGDSNQVTSSGRGGVAIRERQLQKRSQCQEPQERVQVPRASLGAHEFAVRIQRHQNSETCQERHHGAATIVTSGSGTPTTGKKALTMPA